MSEKRRILVVFEPEEGKPQKLAVSIDGEATNGTLARKIAERVGEGAVTLEIGDGFVLDLHDPVAVILDSDIVIARPQASKLGTHATGMTNVNVSGSAYSSQSPSMTTATPPVRSGSSDNQEHASTEEQDGPGRFRFRFVTAELARQYARGTVQEASEAASDGFIAFDYHYVSGNTTFAALRREAAKMFDWRCNEAGFDEGSCDHTTSSFCSCSIAQQVMQHGLSSTLHCRLSIDGTPCINGHCPYSHAPMTAKLITEPPHCSVCMDALAFPCPSCLTQAAESDIEPSSIIFCPIIQNAGCHHIHHAHCIGPRQDSIPLGCPSGCPRGTVLREAIPFDQTIPSLIVVWEGCKIDRIPIPSAYLRDNNTILELKTDDVLTLTEKFLLSKSVRVGDVSVRLHSRKPATETVSFTRSTLVSVCSLASHKNVDHRRFTFGTQTTATSDGERMHGPFVDFHTSQQPLLVCNCTRIKDALANYHDQDNVITLYVVKREGGSMSTSNPKHSAIPVSKQSAYLLDPSWQPSVSQTERGMAAFLSSLFVLSHAMSKEGIIAENKVLAALYAVSRFPPAVRTLGLLFLNITPLPQERAALAHALFYSIEDFLTVAPSAIRSRTSRRFEAARIFFGHLLTLTGSVPAAQRPLSLFSLVCPWSQKRLVDPVLFDSIVVERDVATHFVPSGLLYRPEHGKPAREFTELRKEGDLAQVLSRSAEYHRSEIYILDLNDIAPIKGLKPLGNAACSFSAAIQRTNESVLISHGPLELKSANIVPPQIVLDSKGYLAVFTGRGCGSIRDVNFFQPTSGGDTEVDVNDVEHVLQKTIEARKDEDTWEIDCFGGIPSKTRTPDEAIIFCLDLSQSMNQRSAVGSSSLPGTTPSNAATELSESVAEVLDGRDPADILSDAKRFIREQHESCYDAWVTLTTGGISLQKLAYHLSIIASREVYRIQSTPHSMYHRDQLFLLASFASLFRTDKKIVVQELSETLTNFKINPILGTPPYDVPRHLVNPGTGNLLPASPEPFRTWFSVPVTEPDRISRQTWLSCRDILDSLSPSTASVPVTLRHEGKTFFWSLPISCPTRTLYSLANRATQAKFSSFALRMCISKGAITDSATVPIGHTDLGSGGMVELYRMQPHSRELGTFIIKFHDPETTQTVLLPSDAPSLALLSHIRTPKGHILSEIRLWHGLRDVGDGQRHGTIVNPMNPSIPGTSFECYQWHWTSERQTLTTKSQSLTRLELLKELFNIFLNRVSSFDTSVSLVLGLVTFSDKANVNQQLTPLFDSFRQELDRVQASGNTAMYDALDLARSCLVNFRKDLPELRRRIIVVSDGEDTCSVNDAEKVGRALQGNNIIVDSVQVGTSLSSTLHRISAATAGYRFFPKSTLADALSIFDLETMMYSAERPSRKRMQLDSAHRINATQLWDMIPYPIDVVTIDKFPRRAEHPKLRGRVRDVKKRTGEMALSNDRTRRIMRELNALQTDPHPQIDVYVNEQDMSFLKVVIEAPNDIDQCPYKGGCFLLTCDLPAEYPRDAPEIRFVTFILHPNVSKQGKVCVAELGRLWSSDITLKELLSLTYGLLLEPDLDNPLEIQASLKYYDDDGTFALAAANAVKEHASKSRSEWRKELEE